MAAYVWAQKQVTKCYYSRLYCILFVYNKTAGVKKMKTWLLKIDSYQNLAELPCACFIKMTFIELDNRKKTF